MLAARKRRTPEWFLAVPAVAIVPPQLVIDGGFNGTGPTGNATSPSGSSNTGNYAIVSGQGRQTNGAASASYIWFDIPTVPGRVYDLNVDLIAGTAPSPQCFFNQSGADFATFSAPGTCSATAVTATSTFIRFKFFTNSATSGHTLFFDNMSLKLNETTERDLIITQAKSLGATGLRLDFTGEWVFYGSSAGRYWSDPDAMVNRCIAAGLDVCFVEVSSPAWAAANGVTYPTTELANFALCMQDAAARYAGLVKYWEIRNEQNLAGFSATVAGGGSIASCAAAYMTYAKAVAGGIRAGDPRAKIISAGLSPSPDTTLGVNLKSTDYLAAMYASGAAGVFDMIGYHPYACPNQPNDFGASFNGFRDMIQNIRPIMAANGEGFKPLACTEVGWPTGGTSAGTQTSEALAAQGIIAATHLARDQNIAFLAYYCLMDKLASIAPGTTTDNEDFFGVFRADLTEKPGAAAIRYAQRMLA